MIIQLLLMLSSNLWASSAEYKLTIEEGSKEIIIVDKKKDQALSDKDRENMGNFLKLFKSIKEGKVSEELKAKARANYALVKGEKGCFELKTDEDRFLTLHTNGKSETLYLKSFSPDFSKVQDLMKQAQEKCPTVYQELLEEADPTSVKAPKEKEEPKDESAFDAKGSAEDSQDDITPFNKSWIKSDESNQEDSSIQKSVESLDLDSSQSSSKSLDPERKKALREKLKAGALEIAKSRLKEKEKRRNSEILEIGQLAQKGILSNIQDFKFSSPPQTKANENGEMVAIITPDHVKELLGKINAGKDSYYAEKAKKENKSEESGLLSSTILKDPNRLEIKDLSDQGGSFTLSLHGVKVDRKLKFLVKGSTAQDIKWLSRVEKSTLVENLKTLNDPEMPRISLDEQVIQFKGQDNRTYYVTIIHAAKGRPVFDSLDDFRAGKITKTEMEKVLKIVARSLAKFHLYHAENGKCPNHGDFHPGNVFVDLKPYSKLDDKTLKTLSPEIQNSILEKRKLKKEVTPRVYFIDNANFASTNLFDKKNCDDPGSYHKLPLCSPSGDISRFLGFLRHHSLHYGNGNPTPDYDDFIKVFQEEYKKVANPDGSKDMSKFDQNITAQTKAIGNYRFCRGYGSLTNPYKICQKFFCEQPGNEKLSGCQALLNPVPIKPVIQPTFPKVDVKNLAPKDDMRKADDIIAGIMARQGNK